MPEVQPSCTVCAEIGREGQGERSVDGKVDTVVNIILRRVHGKGGLNEKKCEWLNRRRLGYVLLWSRMEDVEKLCIR